MSKQNHRSALRCSQNFLTSGQVIRRIAGLAALDKQDHVIEIGPGKGHITGALLARCGQVTAVELDPELHAYLRTKFAGAPNLRLVRGDFLALPLPKGPYKVFANIPFSRTTDIVRKLMLGPRPPEEIWLVMEKGAAKRFLGLPRESLASLSLKPWFEGEVRYHFRREDFHPMPAADAVLLHLKRRPAADLTPAQRGAWLRFTAARLPATGDTLYVQWLCLFRRYWDRGGR
ncbi:MAG: rRNA adenine N(6)-methyltransferase family protein [Oscillospiraceae bacterium]|nr:rRNA adenine N(6)-methyltransferase family protein [Oscillospiraceae bacterium]